jgi:hypothetical protein
VPEDVPADPPPEQLAAIGGVAEVEAEPHARVMTPPAEARRTCPGTVEFGGETIEIVILRGVSCTTARRVVRVYDRRFSAPRPWRCALAHAPFDRIDGRIVGFSCGCGGRRGNIRRWPPAFVRTTRR